MTRALIVLWESEKVSSEIVKKGKIAIWYATVKYRKWDNITVKKSIVNCYEKGNNAVRNATVTYREKSNLA